MNEAQRQSYLRALGLTPWVARTTLPGAAPIDIRPGPEASLSVISAPPAATTHHQGERKTVYTQKKKLYFIEQFEHF